MERNNGILLQTCRHCNDRRFEGKNCPLKCADGKKEFGKIVHIQTAEGNARLEKYGQEWGLAVSMSY